MKFMHFLSKNPITASTRNPLDPLTERCIDSQLQGLKRQIQSMVDKISIENMQIAQSIEKNQSNTVHVARATADSIQRMNSKLDSLVDELKNRSEELVRYQSGYDFSIKMRSYFEFMKIRDEINSFRAENKQSLGDSVMTFLGYIEKSIAHHLIVEGLNEIIVSEGTMFNPEEHKCRSTVETDQMAEDRRIHTVLRKGYTLILAADTTPYVIPAEVVIKKYSAPVVAEEVAYNE